MKSINHFFRILFIFVCVLPISGYSQKKLSLDLIYKGGEFSSDYLRGIRSMKDGEHFTVLSEKENEIRRYTYRDYKFLEGIMTLDQLQLSPEESGKKIDGYAFSLDEQKILVALNRKKIYRRSGLANYYIYDRSLKKTTSLHSEKVIVPSFSPDAKKMAYVYKNDLYYRDIATAKVVRISDDGSKNRIINGLADWVYEEEFYMVKAYKWSGDGRYIAYLKFNEQAVPTFSMDMFPPKNPYPSRTEFKYPKAGETNSKVSVHIYDTRTQRTKKIKVSDASEFYVPRLYWTPKSNKLYLYVSNRHQNQVDVLSVLPSTGAVNLVYRERNKYYVDINLNKMRILSDDTFLWTSEKDGYNHIYHINEQGKELRQITSGTWEVTDFYGYDEASERLYYQSTEDGSINRSLYTIDIRAEGKRRLSDGVPGTNVAHFSKKYQYYINIFSNVQTPYYITLNRAKTGAVIQKIKTNEKLASKMKAYDFSDVAFFELETPKKIRLNAFMIKPPNFDPGKKYPLFMYVYGGPGSQTVANRWGGRNMLWFRFLAQNGYVVVSVDNRGTGFKGEEFKKMTYLQLGKYEVEDQIDAARVLAQRPYIDSDRIGIFGWSYGGFMTSLALTKGADVFKLGIAVAPVTNWRYYNTIYTERYMQTPQENPKGYDENSPTSHTDKLKGHYLLIHGSGDDNVHYQNTMRMVESLVQSDKQFDLFVYPNKNHGIYGGNTTMHLRRKMTFFILNNL